MASSPDLVMPKPYFYGSMLKQFSLFESQSLSLSPFHYSIMIVIVVFLLLLFSKSLTTLRFSSLTKGKGLTGRNEGILHY